MLDSMTLKGSCDEGWVLADVDGRTLTELDPMDDHAARAEVTRRLGIGDATWAHGAHGWSLFLAAADEQPDLNDRMAWLFTLATLARSGGSVVLTMSELRTAEQSGAAFKVVPVSTGMVDGEADLVRVEIVQEGQR